MLSTLILFTIFMIIVLFLLSYQVTSGKISWSEPAPDGRANGHHLVRREDRRGKGLSNERLRKFKEWVRRRKRREE